MKTNQESSGRLKWLSYETQIYGDEHSNQF